MTLNWNSSQKILITGAAGFIGASLWRTLSAQLRSAGRDPQRDLLLVCDARKNFDSRSGLFNEPLPPILDRDELFTRGLPEYGPTIGAIFHIGASSSTLQLDEDYLRRMNVEYSQKLWAFARERNIPFIYASSGATYGLGIEGRPDAQAYDDDPELLSRLKPISPYGWSKHRFDLWAQAEAAQGRAPRHWAGFKYFNVYGWGEAHKGTGASMVYHWFQQISQTGAAKLFKSYRNDFKDGEQKRDFIWVEDINRVMITTLSQMTENAFASGIYNLGTGQAHTWLELSQALFKAMGRPTRIEWIEMPDDLRARYQYFTQATMDRLRGQIAGLAFSSLETGVSRYVQQLQK